MQPLFVVIAIGSYMLAEVLAGGDIGDLRRAGCILGKTLLFDCDFLHTVESGYSSALMDRFEAHNVTKLSSLGFAKGVHCEAIVTTLNPDGSPNAAPMGMQMKDEQHLTLNVYNTAQTCQNLQDKKFAVVNLTNSIKVFYRTTFKEANPNGRIPATWFVKSESVVAPRLRHADATIEVAVSSLSVGEERTIFNFKVEAVAAKEQLPQVYCRALPLTIEAITHATRVKAFMHVPEKSEQVEQLIETIRSHAKIVERVAPSSEFSAVFQDLEIRIKTWRTQP